MSFYFLPEVVPSLDALTFFGIALFLCHIVGELAFKLKFIPRISGYILTGVILGPNFLNLVDKKTIYEMGILTDISVGLTLFMIGRYLDIRWLINDRGLLYTSIAEFAATFLAFFGLTFLFGWNMMHAFFAAAIIATTSPAIMLLISQDLNAEGPVTRRALIITSVNNFMALCLIALMVPFAQASSYSTGWLLAHALYRMIGSLFLGFIFFKVIDLFATYVFSKKVQEQFILIISVLVMAIGFSKNLNLSVYLVLFAMGISTRNFDSKHSILECNLSLFTHIFFIPLFFITGCYLDFSGFLKNPIIILLCIALRVATKFYAVFAFRKLSLLTKKQAFYIGSALIPLSGTALGITSKISDFSPELGSQLILIVSSYVGVFGLLGPLALQYALLASNEAFDNLKRV